MRAFILSNVPGRIMGKYKKENEQVERSELKPVEKEGGSSSWIQKYLDLADLLTRRRKHKRPDDDRPKAA
jgi:hypothetical protein